MCSSHTNEKAVPPTAMPITAAAKAAYEKSITAFIGVPLSLGYTGISAAQTAPAAAQKGRAEAQLWRTRGSPLLPAPRVPALRYIRRMAKTVAIVEDDPAIRA